MAWYSRASYRSSKFNKDYLFFLRLNFFFIPIKIEEYKGNTLRKNKVNSLRDQKKVSR